MLVFTDLHFQARLNGSTSILKKNLVDVQQKGQKKSCFEPVTSPPPGQPAIWCPYKTSPHKTSPHKTSPHKTSPHKTSPHKRSPVTKRHPTKRHLPQNVTSTKRHQKTSPVTKCHLIVAVSTMRNNTSSDIIAVGT